MLKWESNTDSSMACLNYFWCRTSQTQFWQAQTCTISTNKNFGGKLMAKAWDKNIGGKLRDR